jgi:hypothetical protein
MQAGRVEVIAGINLPMLIRLAGARKSANVLGAVVAARECGPQLYYHRVRISGSGRLKQLTRQGETHGRSTGNRQNCQRQGAACAGQREIRQYGRHAPEGLDVKVSKEGAEPVAARSWA